MEPLQIFQLFFFDCNGGASFPNHSDSSQSIPVIDVVINSKNNISQGGGVSCLALIDTGADYCCVGKDILEAIGAPVVRSIYHRGISGGEQTTVHDVDIVFTAIDGSTLTFSTDVCMLNTTGQSPYSIILGRSFLKNGALVMDYDNTIFQWRFKNK